MNDCIFCQIVANKIPNVTVYEDDVVKAFLDITQVTPGHTLVVPKRHVPDIFAYDTELASAVFERIPMIATAIKNSNPDIKGMNIMNNNGEVAYQSVFHSHIHLLPRYDDADDFSIHFGDHSADYDTAKLEAVAETIRHQLEVQ
ncbi:HIT family protein [Lacticaseibacillus saniviri]|uniref:Cell-cycle regulation Hit-like protein n=1 Tax=Lacticaseibacillus saniviri JCM 17471 = DSM 24301 TaxID=1293598 RepID=A0A0R2MYG0_9LACO|nr:HIT family protein [Lacticaseibacillus saniviri]KRO16675.1 cell-cycle regulation Hit-like protein [Lacticaseibacillus saniviri JCM 17471 = DSM 24301]MCG4280813.1 HIT family protein [Lacticaseibacillus saniviri]